MHTLRKMKNIWYVSYC